MSRRTHQRCSRAPLALALGIALVALAPPARIAAQGAEPLTCASPGGTTVEGALTTSARWTRAASPYRVGGTLTLRGAGVTLTVEPGTLVCGASTAYVMAQDGARIDARGTATDPVVFTALDSTKGWPGFILDGAPASPSAFVNAVVAFTGRLDAVTGITGIRAQPGHRVIVDSAVIRRASGPAVFLSPGSRISRSLVETTVSMGDSSTFEDTRVVLSRGAGIEIFGIGVRLLGGSVGGSTDAGIACRVDRAACIAGWQPVRVSAAAGFSVILSPMDFALLYPTPADQDELLGGITALITRGELAGRDLTLGAGRQYRVQGPVAAAPGTTIRLLPGTRLTFEYGGLVLDRSRLLARGTAAAPIVFTGAAWDGIELRGSPPDTSFLTNVLIEGARRGIHGGRIDSTQGTPTFVAGELVAIDSARIRQSERPVVLGHRSRISRSVVDTSTGESSAAIEVRGDGALVEDVRIHGARNIGIQLVGLDTRLRNVTVQGHGAIGIRGTDGVERHLAEARDVRVTGGTSAGGFVAWLSTTDFAVLAPTPAEQGALTGNACDCAVLAGGRLAGRALTLGAALRYWNHGSYLVPTVVDAGGTLTLLPGVEVRNRWYAQIEVRAGGRLVARGTASAPIRLVADGPVTLIDRWVGVELLGTQADTAVLEHVEIEDGLWGVHAGMPSTHVAILDHVTIRRTRATAALLRGPGSRLANSTIDGTLTIANEAVSLGPDAVLEGTVVRGAAGNGIFVTGTGVRLGRCEVTGSGAAGVVFDASAGGAVNDCNLVGNRGPGVDGRSPTAVDARWNWWGSERGPLPSGDGVWGQVAYDPWLTQRVDLASPQRVTYWTQLAPDSVRIDRAGATVRLQATVREGSTVVASAVSWSSSDPRIATVDADGVATAVAHGFTWIVAAPLPAGAADSARLFVDLGTPVASCAAAGGRTHAAGMRTESEFWRRYESPHRVDGDVTFEGTDIQLRIEEGVVVCAAPGAAIRFRSGALLLAYGTQWSPVTFTAADSTRPWYGLHFTDWVESSTSTIDNAVVERSLWGIRGEGKYTIWIDSTRIRQSDSAAVALGGPWSVIIRSVIDTTRSARHAAVTLGDSATFEETTVRGAAGVGILLAGDAGGRRLMGGRVEGSGGTGILGTNEPAYTWGARLREARPVRVTGGAGHAARLNLADLALLYPTPAAQDSLVGNAADTVVIGAAVGTPLRQRLVLGPSVVFRVEPGDALSIGKPVRVAVDPEGVLEVGPGARLAFASNANLAMTGGRLDIRGTAASPAVLTAVHPASPWYGIDLYASRPQSSAIVHALIEYSRYGVVSRFAPSAEHFSQHSVTIDSTRIRQSVTWAANISGIGARIRHSVIDTTTAPAYASGAVELGWNATFEETVVRGAAQTGLYVGGGNVRLLGGRIEGSGGTGIVGAAESPSGGIVVEARPIRVTGAARPVMLGIGDFACLYPTADAREQLRGNVVDEPIIRGGRFGSCQSRLTLDAAMPVRIRDTVTVTSTRELELRPGTRLLLDSAALLDFDGGRLLAQGTAASPVRLTATDPAKWWQGIVFRGSRPHDTSRVTNAILEYATATIREYTVVPQHPVVLDSVRIAHAYGTAVVLTTRGSRLSRSVVDTGYRKSANDAWHAVALRGAVLVEQTIVRGAPGHGVVVEAPGARLDRCEVTRSGFDGIVVSTTAPAAVVIRDCNLVDNWRNGVAAPADAPAGAVDARWNWWGDPAGPRGPAGDGVSGNVLYEPWHTARVDIHGPPTGADRYAVVTPDSIRLTSSGVTAQLAAQLFDETGPVAGTVTWTSRDAAVATVSTGGLVTAVANGATWVVAAPPAGRADSAHVTVEIPRPNTAPTIAIVAPLADTTLLVGDSVRVLAEAADADGDTVTVTWTTMMGDSTIATMAGAGPHWLRFVKAGSYTVAAVARDGRGASSPVATRAVAVTGRGTNVDVAHRNSQGRVDGHDLVFVIRARRTQDLRGDVNGDGVVDATDIALVRAALGQRPPAGAVDGTRKQKNAPTRSAP